MTRKYYWAMAVIAAFVAGTILASSYYENTAFAIHQPNHNPGDNDDEDMGWKQAVAELQEQIENLDVNDADSDPTNELGPILGFYSTTEFLPPITAEQQSIGYVSIYESCEEGDIAVNANRIMSGIAPPSFAEAPKTVDERVFDENASITLENIREGYVLGIYVLCADLDPAHVP